MIAALAARLVRLAGDCRPAGAPRGGLTTFQSARVIDYMQSRLGERITLAELAEQVRRSPWHFARAFRESHGVPPYQYLLRLRIERARELLARSNLPIGEIAAATGWSPQQLAQHFRRELGVSPQDYRRQTRGHP